MPFANIGSLACENLQTDLVDYFGQNVPEYRTLGSLAFLKWLLSPQNTSGFKQINVGERIPGKKHGVAFQLEQPYCFEIARKARACDSTPATIEQFPEEIVFNLTADPYRPVSGVGDDASVLRISLADMQQYCTVDDPKWIQKQIIKFLLRFELEFSKAMLGLAEPMIGNTIDGESVLNLPFWVKNSMTNGVSLNPEAQFYLDQAMNDVGVNSQYAVIGGAIINKTRKFLDWACCDNAGVDMSLMDPGKPWSFYDRNADQILGQYDMILMPPGIAQVVTWNEFGQGSSTRKEISDLYSNSTITLPNTGLTVDFKWRFDYNCNIWIFEPFLRAELAFVPPGGCLPDGIEGVNGSLRVHDCTLTPVRPACPEVIEG